MRLLQLALAAVLSATPFLGTVEVVEAHPSHDEHSHRKTRFVYADNRCDRSVRVKLRWYEHGRNRVGYMNLRPGLRRLTYNKKSIRTNRKSVSWKIYYPRKERWGSWVRTKDGNNDERIQFTIHC